MFNAFVWTKYLKVWLKKNNFNVLIGSAPVTDSCLAALTISRLMRTFDIKGNIWPVPSPWVYIVEFFSYVSHQTLQSPLDVLRHDAGRLHWSCRADFAVLTETSHLDDALSPCQVHVEDHHHSIGRPASSTDAALEPWKWQKTKIDPSPKYNTMIYQSISLADEEVCERVLIYLFIHSFIYLSVHLCVYSGSICKLFDYVGCSWSFKISTTVSSSGSHYV